MTGRSLRLLYGLGVMSLALITAGSDAAAQSPRGRYPRCETQPGFANTTLTVVITAQVAPNLQWTRSESPGVVARGILGGLNENARNITFREASGVVPNLFLTVTLGGTTAGTTQATAHVEVTGLGKPGILFRESSGASPFNSFNAALDRLAANMVPWFENGWSTIPPCIRNGRLVRGTSSGSARSTSLFDAGFYGGGVWATDWFEGEEFNTLVEPGWTGGVMVQAGRGVGLRADLIYVSFGKRSEVADGATFESSTSVLAGTLAAVLDVGGLYLLGGGGRYQLKFEGTCEGSCGGVTEDSTTDDYWGANGGLGIKLRLGGLSPFFEGRVHTVFPNEGDEEGNGTFLTGTFGLRFR